ncbi:ribonuclease ii [Quercus suber]|uniref:Ribonuclease ii n=1 Tax=Quercus suber TaxID=58331 RepID=A0AAW0L5E5_QUESU
MAVRAVNSCSIFRSASPPPFSAAVRCRLYHYRNLQFRRYSKLGFRFHAFRSGQKLFGHGGFRSCSVHSLVDSVMEELEFMRKRKRVYAASKVLLAVAQKPDGKKNWMVSDQVLVETTKCGMLNRLLALLEFAWVELLENNKSVTTEELAEMIFGSAEPLESYCAHLLLSKDETYFSVLETKGSRAIYGPRPTVQNGVTSSIKPQQITYIVPGIENFDHTGISDFIQKAQDNLDPALLEFAWVELLENNKSVTTEELAEMIFGSAEPLESYCAHLLLSKDETYFSVLETKGSRAIYGPRPTVQVQELLRWKLAKEAAEQELQEFIQLLKSAKNMPSKAKPRKSSWLAEEKIRHKIESLESYAIDACKNDDQKKTAGMIYRKDLTHLKVYAIDVDEADELDDALSATRLQDGRIKVWIHVADAARFVQPGSMVDREAMRRGTSIFLPTATYPMFPENLAMKGMSLKQGEICNAVTASVVLRSDGSIAEFSVDNSVIKPTYMLTYESASELLHLNLEEETELKILSEAATLRLQWRQQQDPEPVINLYVENQADPAMRLVTEMMLLCGEVIATYGSRNNISLPYRGQPQSNIDVSLFQHLPEGPIRSSAIVKLMRAAEIDFRKPIRHGILGLPGYVQFTSPIRRYMDLLAHYQVKAYLRGESPPFSAGQLEGMASILNMHSRLAKRLFSSSLRYWILEYLRSQPKERKYRGFQASAWVSVGAQIGDEVEVRVDEAHPRDDFISLKEVI